MNISFTNPLKNRRKSALLFYGLTPILAILFFLGLPNAVQAQSIDISKTVNDAQPIVGEPITFTIQITNTSGSTLAAIPLTDTYDTAYLSYSSLVGSTPASDENVNDGVINWSDITGGAGLADGASVVVTAHFIAVGETVSLSAVPPCSAGVTCNVVTSLGESAFVEVAIAKETKSSIGDFVWQDLDANGLQNDGATGINGVLLNLYLDGLNGNPVDGVIQPGEYITSTTTADDPTSGDAGYYDFAVSDNHIFLVEVDSSNFDPNGPLEDMAYTSENTDPSLTEPRVVIVGDGPFDINDVDFGYYVDPAPSAIGNTVWLDENGDGIQDPGESGIPNVEVQLTDSNGNIITTTTDTTGGYIFADLPEGTYTITVDSTTLPAGLAPNPTFDEDDGVTNPDGETVVTLAPGEEHLTSDFGFNWVPPTDSTNPPLDAPGAIGDKIWLDTDGDGEQDPGEIGLADVTVSLLTDDNGDGVYGGVGDSPAITTTTDAAGNYIFDDIDPGSYVIEVDSTTIPAGATQTGDPDTTLDNRTEPIVLAPGDVILTADFGYDPTSSSDIGDAIFVDINGDGVQDPDEPGIGGVTVALLDSDGNIIATDTTDDSGNYLFPDLPAGTYTIQVTDVDNVLSGMEPISDADGGDLSQSTVTVDGISPNLDQDFGFTPDGHDPADGFIGDTIFLDTGDGAGGAPNGTPDSGEGLEGVEVILTYSTGFTRTTTTDENGNYYLGGLDATQTYTVNVNPATLPAGVTNTIDPGGGNDNASTVDLAVTGPTDMDQDFGYTADAPATISGTIWTDTDANGTLDGDEPERIEDVTIVLKDPDGNIVAQTTTDVDGNYTFANLPPGDYTLEITDDNNVLDGTWASVGTPGTPGESQSTPTTITVTSGATEVIDYGFYSEPGSVGNLIWVDLDGDGLYEPGDGETGYEGAVAELTVTYPNGTVVTATTTSDANGIYTFTNLLLDEQFDGVGAVEPTYSVSIDLPAGYASSYDGTPDSAGIGNGTDNNADNHVAEEAFPTIGDVDNTNDFGLAQPSLEIDKDTDTHNVVRGQQGTYSIVVRNITSQTAFGVTITDTLPTGFTYASSTGDVLENATRTTTVDPAVGATTAVWSGWTIQVGGAITLTFQVDVDANAPLGTFDNTASAAADNFPPVDDDGTVAGDDDTPPGEDPEYDEDITVLPGPPQYVVEKVLNTPDPVMRGEDISFTIRITNTGLVTITVLPLEDYFNNAFIEYQSASISPSSALAGLLQWEDLTVTEGNLVPGGSIVIDVYFETLADTTLLPPMASCTDGGHAPNLARAVGVKADLEGDDGLLVDDVDIADAESCDGVRIFNPTAVSLANFSAKTVPNGVLVEWSTISESDTVGFYIWKTNGVNAEVRNENMIFAVKPGQSLGASYQWLDEGASLNGSDIYILETVDSNGLTERSILNVANLFDTFLPFMTR